ncbi:hypothetical protein F5Y15DRAFT_414356 [Xylariaceae sp. FL0016]|nr:hypothetical protein F5Y15DRAFT_414356 [Xylariaceae sp. FL0016]
MVHSIKRDIALNGGDLLDSGFFSDITVICDERAWNLHRAILSSRCQWFEKALQGNSKKSNDPPFFIESVAEEEFDCIVTWIYTGEAKIIPQAFADEYNGFERLGVFEETRGYLREH